MNLSLIASILMLSSPVSTLINNVDTMAIGEEKTTELAEVISVSNSKYTMKGKNFTISPAEYTELLDLPARSLFKKFQSVAGVEFFDAEGKQLSYSEIILLNDAGKRLSMIYDDLPQDDDRGTFPLTFAASDDFSSRIVVNMTIEEK